MCAEQFEPRWAGRAWTRTCSTSCARELRARPSRKPKVTLTCEVCKRTWEVQPSQAKGRRSCSRACAAKLKRQEGAGTRKGTTNPNYRGGQRAGERDREGERRWYAAMGRRCEAPDCPGNGGRLALHHVVYRQAVRRANGDVWDPRNALTLCNSCHGSHHHRGRVLPLTALPDAVFAFAAETLGAGPAYEYLRRRYVDDDSRLALLIGAA